MYGIGDVVVYSSNGVCRVDEITNKKIAGEKMEYYVLTPVYAETSTLFVPIKNDMLVKRMRYVLSQNDIKFALDSADKKPKWINDKNERFEFCRNSISDGNFKNLVEIMRSFKTHEKQQGLKGKHLHISDERLLKEVEKMLFDEVCYVFNVERSEVAEMIL